MGHGGPSIELDEVAELRSLLRRTDVAARQIGLALLREWPGRCLDDIGARAVLEAAGGSYPVVAGSAEHPAEMLARLLWESPRQVPVPDVLRTYLVAGERARRAFVHLLALRGDDEGLDGLEFVVGASAPAELLPIATTPLLDPLAAHADRARVTQLLGALLTRAGWTWHAGDLLRRLESERPSAEASRCELHDQIAAAVTRLVDVCNRAALAAPASGDPARTDRQALASLMWLLDELPEQDPTLMLGAMLGSADPRVAAMAAARLVGRGESVAPERLSLIARDPVARADLYDGLALRSPDHAAAIGPVAVAEGELARFLSDVTELGRAPDELEHLATVAHPATPGAALHVFRFRMRAPHWSAARGWMIGVGGACTYTCYAAEDECSVVEHVTAVLAALAEWPDRRADGAA